MISQKLSHDPLAGGASIVMSHLGRVGSTVLSSMLNKHSKIRWMDEYFTLMYQRDPEAYCFSATEMLSMVSSEYLKMRRYWRVPYVGYEIKPVNFLNNPGCEMLDYLRLLVSRENAIHIFLRRKNVLKRICSSHKAYQTKVYHLLNEEEDRSDGRFVLDLKNLIDFDTEQRAATLPELIRKAIDFEEFMLRDYRQLGISFLALSYEEDIELDPACGYRKVIDYLGLDFESVPVDFKKTSRSLEDDLQNYKEVEAELSDTEYAWMLS